MYRKLFEAVILLTVIILPVVTIDGTESKESKTFDGYTLIAPNFHTTTYLIDMDGNVVHYWLNDGSPAISAYFLENGNLLRTSTVDQLEQPAGGQRSPGGGFGGRGGFGGMGGFGAMPGFGAESRGGGAGGRVQEIDWDGKVVWEFKFVSDDHITHHDIEILPNGNIICIAWERKTAQETIDAGRNPTMQGNSVLHPDFIIEVKPDKVNNGGEIVWQWHSWDHLIQDFDPNKANFGKVAEHPELIDINFTANRTVTPASGTQPAMPGFGGAPGGRGGTTMPGLTGAGGTMPPDWLHTNAIDYNPDLDQIAISCYGFSEIWVIDHSTTTEQAKGHSGGRYGKGGDLIYRWGNPRAYRAGTEADQKFFNQHDVHWIVKGRPGAGHIMIFNNGPYRTDGDYSSVDEIVTPVDAKGNYPLEKGKAYGPKEILWSYSAPNKTDFYSMHISGAERQPNGNTLICSGAFGVFFEVTPDKKVIWRCAYTGGDGPNGPDLKSMFGGGMMGGGFGGPGGGRGGFPGMPGFGGQQPAATEKLSRFVVSREDPTLSGLKGMPASLPKWGGGTGFGNMETQIFRAYRYTADYPGLKGKDLTVKK